MLKAPNKAGQRIGDWFLWIEAETAKTDSYRRIPIVTVRKAVSGGNIIQTCVATKTMANELRNIADTIDKIVDGIGERSSVDDEA